MSGTTNKPFKEGMGAADPRVYLRNNLFNSQPAGGMIAGRMLVNLTREGNLIDVEPAPAQRGCYSSIFTNQFHAFWGPNRRGQSVSVVLNDTADYYFTPGLTGCILEINNLTVTHHDGELAVFPPATLALVPAAVPLGAGVAAAAHRQWECPAGFGCSMVIGVRMGPGNWHFWQQSYNPAASRTPLPLAQVTRI